MKKATVASVLVLVIVSFAYFVCPGWGEPPEETMQAVARLEKIGGQVGIDGEHPRQPVWKVDLYGTPAGDAELELISRFSDLEELCLDETQITDEGLKWLARLSNLRELSLQQTAISDAGLRHLVGLSRLEYLGLDGTRASIRDLQQFRQFASQQAAGDARVQTPRRTPSSVVSPTGEPAGVGVSPPANTDDAEFDDPSGDTFEQMGVSLFVAAGSDAQQRDQAIALLEEAVARDPDNDTRLLNLADAYVVIETDLSLALATDLYEDVLERNPRDGRVLGRLAKTYLMLGNWETSLDFAQQRLAGAGSQDRYQAALQVALITITGGVPERGLEVLQPVIEGWQNPPALRLLQATLLGEADRREEARSLIQQVLARIPADSPLTEEASKLLERLAP